MRLLYALAIGACVLFAGQAAGAPPDVSGSVEEPIRMRASEFPSDDRSLAMESPTQLFIRIIEGDDGDEDPGDEDPGDEDPGDEDPGDEDPGDEDPGDEDPGDEDPGDEDPGDEDPGDEDPGDEDPGDEDPGDEDPGDEAPGDEDPGDEDPGDEDPGDEDPGDEDPGDEDPGDEEPEVAPVPVNDGNAHIGMNLSRINYYTAQWWDVNVVKWVQPSSGNYYSPWMGGSSRELELREDGWPAGLVHRSGNIQSASSSGGSTTITSSNHGLRRGDVVRFNGSQDARVTSVSGNQFTVNASVGSSGSWEYQQKATGLTLRDIQGRYPTGDYTLKFEGRGAIELHNAAPGDRYENDGDGEAEFTVPIDGRQSGVEFNIVESDSSDPVRNVRLYMPGFDDGDDFHPLFLERLEPFRGVIRHLNSGRANSSNVRHWDERTPPDWPWHGEGGRVQTRTGTATRLEDASNGGMWDNWGTVARVTSPDHGLVTGQVIDFRIDGIIWASESPVRRINDDVFEVRTQAAPGTQNGNWEWTLEVRDGMAFEHMIEMSNRTRSHMWICVPMLADDNYMRNLAQLIRDELDSDLKVYVELSNEVWNTIFSQYLVSREWASRDNTSMHDAYATRARELFAIFHDEFAGQEDRVIRVVGSQRVSWWRSQEILRHMNGEFDALAVTTYFSGVGSSQPSGVTGADIAQQALNEVSSDEWLNGLQEQANLVDQYSDELGRDIQFLAYEGGQHVSANGRDLSHQQALFDAQTHPIMGEAYQVMIDRFESVGGDLLVPYSYVLPQSKYGSWGHLEFQDDDPSDHPKYQTLVDHVNELLGTDY